MIRLVEALGFRALEYVRQPLDRFQILVGPNASGKSTFLGAVDILGKLVDAPRDISQPLRELSPNFRDLTFMRGGTRFELAIEALVPDPLRPQKENGERNGAELVRYEVSLGETEPSGTVSVVGENLWLKGATEPEPPPAQRSIFPEPLAPPEHLVHPERTKTPHLRNLWLERPVQLRAEPVGAGEPTRGRGSFPSGGLVPAVAHPRYPAARPFQRSATSAIPAWKRD